MHTYPTVGKWELRKKKKKKKKKRIKKGKDGFMILNFQDRWLNIN